MIVKSCVLKRFAFLDWTVFPVILTSVKTVGDKQFFNLKY